METVLSVDGLCKHYRQFHALNGLSLRVPKGAIYGLVGRNGAGKTTLIRLICGLQEPSAGEFTLYGAKNNSTDIYAARRRMGAVVETPSLYLSMNAEENLKMQYRVLGLPSFEGVGELLSLVGLADTGKKTVRHFSLGMKARLGIAVALCGDPDFLVLDEPVNGLDPQGIIEMRELILRLNRERGVTLLISSHILDELSRIATHYAFVDRGATVKEISAEELEALSRKCTRVQVTNPNALARILEQSKLDYRMVGEDTADIYAAFDVSALVLALHEADCRVLSLTERDESLESFYVGLLGGARHE